MILSWKRLTVFAIFSAVLAAETAAQTSVQVYGNGKLITLPETPLNGEIDATRTKQFLDQVFRLYPPSLKQVVQLDYSLLSNKAYLAAYPKLAEFLDEYPAVVRDPAFFIGSPPSANPNSSTLRQVTNVYRTDDLALGIVILGIIGGIAWLIRATIAHQKWLRLSKGQAEAQAKLLERFTSNEDLLNFIQTPAGRQFLEASSMPAQPKAVSAPISQILWSIQIGLVLFTGGMGLIYVKSQAEGAAGMFHILGVLVMALGVGFILSGLSSYILSRKFGLLSPTDVTSQTPPS
jgi:hypothetical protein